MKAILEFDLTDVDDVTQHGRALKALDLALALFEIDQELRNIIKYGREGYDVETAEQIRTTLRKIQDDHLIDLDDLLN